MMVSCVASIASCAGRSNTVGQYEAKWLLLNRLHTVPILLRFLRLLVTAWLCYGVRLSGGQP